MGVRLYNPATGRFLSVDPIQGGNANPYTYPNDPINDQDLTGQWGFRKWLKTHWKGIVHTGVGFATAAASVAIAAAACSTGVGCVIIAAAALNIMYGTAAQIGAAKAMHQKVDGGKVARWMGQSVTGVVGRGHFVGKYGKAPLGYLWSRMRN